MPIRTRQGRELGPHKAILSAQLAARTVLTESPWDFVALWLKRQHQPKAVILWNQGREFYEAARGLSLQTAPLLLYYSFLNASKALLVAKGVPFDEWHGITNAPLRATSDPIKLVNEGIAIKTKGVLPALSRFLLETETNTEHTLKEIFFNLVYIHRTYCLTYRSQPDMFVPLKDCQFALDESTGHVFFAARISENFPMRGLANLLPPSFALEGPQANRGLRSTATVSLASPHRLSASDLQQLSHFNRSLRCDIHYINASQTLWYLKLTVRGPKKLNRFPLTLTLAAMHRLSEICRYRPIELSAFLDSQENWLLSEFIRAAPWQFVDAIASELTGFQFLVPNVRPAS